MAVISNMLRAKPLRGGDAECRRAGRVAGIFPGTATVCCDPGESRYQEGVSHQLRVHREGGCGRWEPGLPDHGKTSGLHLKTAGMGKSIPFDFLTRGSCGTSSLQLSDHLQLSRSLTDQGPWPLCPEIHLRACAQGPPGCSQPVTGRDLDAKPCGFQRKLGLHKYLVIDMSVFLEVVHMSEFP